MWLLTALGHTYLSIAQMSLQSNITAERLLAVDTHWSYVLRTENRELNCEKN
jgi:hypothetical protein